MEGLFLKRIQKELKMIKDYKGIVCEPIDESLKVFHFTIQGENNSPYEGGIYHGEIVLPQNYPMGAPTIQFLTENGRFRQNEKICLNATSYHDFSWQSSWTILQLLRGLSLFMLNEEQGVGYQREKKEVRQIYAQQSKYYKCHICGFEYEKHKEEFKQIQEEIQQEEPQEQESEIEESQEESEEEQVQEQYDVLRLTHLLNKEDKVIRYLQVLRSFTLHEKDSEEQNYEGRDVTCGQNSKQLVNVFIFVIVFLFFLILSIAYLNSLYKLLVLNN